MAMQVSSLAAEAEVRQQPRTPRAGSPADAVAGITDPLLSNLLVEAATARANSQFEQSADIIEAALALTNPAAVAQLTRLKNARIGPWALALWNDRLQCLRRARKAPTDQYLRECDLALATFRASAAGRRWQAYKEILLLRALHFRDLLDPEAQLQALHDATAYDPADERCLYEYLTVLLTNTGAALDPAMAQQVRGQIDEYRRQSKLCSARIAIVAAYVNAGSQSNAMTEALTVLCNAGMAQPADYRAMLDMLRAMLDPTNLAQMQAYHKALTALAVKQPPTPNGAKMVAYILSEQRKLEMLMPELKAGDGPAITE